MKATDKPRLCAFEECRKPIPWGKSGRTKYCCVACWKKAYTRRIAANPAPRPRVQYYQPAKPLFWSVPRCPLEGALWRDRDSRVPDAGLGF